MSDAITPQKQQAIIARELIDMYQAAPNKREAAESLDVICFAMARLCEDAPAIDWDMLAATFDGLAQTDDSLALADLEKLYQKVIKITRQSQ